MLLPEIKEREYRFKLALRMGLPIFALILAFVSNTLINNYESLQASFYFSSILLLTFSIYFIFFLIYSGFSENITENVSKTFTREYLYKYLKKEIKKQDKYTLILLSVDNLAAINTRYGIKNGDKVLFEFVKYVEQYFKDKKITNFPMGHIKAGDFIIGFKGPKEEFNTVMDLLCLKSSEFKIQEMETSISGAITDTLYSHNLDHMIENLFEIQEENKNKKIIRKNDDINPNDLENYVLTSIKSKSVSIMTQSVFTGDGVMIKECFVKLKISDTKILHPKSYMKVVDSLGLRAEYDFLILQKVLEHCIDDSQTMISITISPSSLRNHNFLGQLKESLEANHTLKDRIIMMMSEVDYYSQIQKYNTTLQALRRQGIKIGVDRLGSLHTSFLYLRELEIDIVRFDSFYTKEIQNQKNKSTVEGLNSMAHLLGVKTWIKMLENEEENQLAQAIGIDYRQGKVLSSLEKV